MISVVASMACSCSASTDAPDVDMSSGKSDRRRSEVENEPPKSQEGGTSQRVGDTWISIRYSRPVARGRALFGRLVPFGEIWNPGANQATKMQIDSDVMIEGQRLAASTYSLWMIPRPTEWTVIFNRVAEANHKSYPGEQSDALRFSAKPETGSHLETLALYFPFVDGRHAILRMHWGEVMVPIHIQTVR